jgi:hypothetical protein
MAIRGLMNADESAAVQREVGKVSMARVDEVVVDRREWINPYSTACPRFDLCSRAEADENRTPLEVSPTSIVIGKPGSSTNTGMVWGSETRFLAYAGPFVLAAGSNIRFRAVDVNGNIEATHELTA